MKLLNNKKGATQEFATSIQIFRFLQPVSNIANPIKK